MKVTSREEFYSLVAAVADGIAHCGSIAPSAEVYLELNDASRGHARAVFSRGTTGDVLVYVEVTKP